MALPLGIPNKTLFN